jgi:hypothetical protein
MNKLIIATLVHSCFVTSASAAGGHAFQGLFCNTEGQLEETIGYVRTGLTVQAATEVTNRTAVVCVYADRVSYVVIRPFIIGRLESGGTVLFKYQATLVSVLVGDNQCPVRPPVPIFFALPERLSGAPTAGSA